MYILTNSFSYCNNYVLTSYSLYVHEIYKWQHTRTFNSNVSDFIMLPLSTVSDFTTRYGKLRLYYLKKIVNFFVVFLNIFFINVFLLRYHVCFVVANVTQREDLDRSYEFNHIFLYFPFITKTHIYIYIIQGLRHPGKYYKHIFTFTLYKDYDTQGSIINTHTYIYTIQGLRYPREALQFFAYIPVAVWTIQHLTDTLAFKDH